MRHLATVVALVLGLALAVPTEPATSRPVDEEDVTRVASLLRCVVCQNLSVADSPSEMARQMRDVVRERLALGETRDQVLAYFVEKYGDWILLSPPLRGFSLVVWVLPAVGLLLGAVVVLTLVRRWTRRPLEAPAATEPVPAADRERVRLELERLAD